MKRNSNGFWIWCTFSKSDEAYLQNIQKKVQEKFNGPEFKIHLTINGPYASISKELYLLAEEIASKKNPFKIFPNAYEVNSDFFKAFCISLQSSKNLDGLKNKFALLKNENYEDLFYPHISLTYGKHKNQNKNEFIPKLPKLKDHLMVENISIVYVDENIFKWDEVSSFSLL